MARWRKPPPLLLLFLTAALTTAAQPSSLYSEADARALLSFKSVSDTSGRLTTWNTSDTNPCVGSWYGVSCLQGRVSRLVLEGLSLSGQGCHFLAALDQLRVLSLKWNLLSGPVPDLSNLTALKLLFLSHNEFSGPFPTSLASLSRLYRLDLSSNNFSGPLPAAAINSLTHLLTLRLDQNQFTGPISALHLPNLQDFNVSGNFLITGAVPPSLAVFPASAFQGNPSLCGPPLSSSCNNVVSDPSRPGSASPGGTLPPSSPLTTSPAATAVVSSTPGSNPDVVSSSSTSASPEPEHRDGRMSRVAVVAIVVGDFAVLVLVSGLLFCYFWKKYSGSSRSRLQEGEKIVYSSSPYTSQGGGNTAGAGGAAGGGFERGKMVFFEGTKRFELEDLLRASAEMLGKGGYGTAYKAVLDDGSVVAVKRLREASGNSSGGGGGAGKREFDQHMEVLGRLRHPNLVSLKAYYYARDEKLLVYEYMPNGNLFSLLHGNRGPGRTPLDWTTRLRIAAGAARGLAFIHHNCRSSPKLTHGNIKSTNVLLDKSGNARVSDFGLCLLGPTAIPPRSNGYRAPEASTESGSSRAKPSHKADVYAFGVLLLEMLTGKYPLQVPENGGGGVVDLPRWVQSVVREEWTAEVFDLELMRYKDIEEEMVGMLQIAMACTSTVPDQRPSMAHALKMIEEIRGGEVSPSHESFDSVSDSPSVSEDAGM